MLHKFGWIKNLKKKNNTQDDKNRFVCMEEVNQKINPVALYSDKFIPKLLELLKILILVNY